MTEHEPGYQPPDLALVGAEHIRRYQETGGIKRDHDGHITRRSARTGTNWTR